MKKDNKQKSGSEMNTAGDSMSGIQNNFQTAEVFIPSDSKLHTVPVTGRGKPDVPEAIKNRWMSSLSLLVSTSGVSTGVVMQIKNSGVEVLLCDGEKISAYTPGSFFPFGTGSYCETSIGLNRFVMLDIPAESSISRDEHNPPRHYYGIPIHWDDGSFYGTLCLLCGDNKPQEIICPLVTEFACSMEKDLELLCLRRGRDEKSEKYERSMEAVLQYSPGGIFSYSAEEDEQFSYISENMLTFLGYTLEEFIHKFENRFSMMVYEEDRERTLSQINEQIQRGPFDRVEYRIEKKGGELAWVHDEGHIVADFDGKKWFYVVIVDISESVKAQQQEREKYRNSMQALLSANPDAVATVHLNLTRNICTEGHSTSNTTREFIKAETADGFFAAVSSQIPDPEMRRNYLAAFDRNSLLTAFASGKTSQNHEFIRRSEGAPVWIRTNLNLLKNPDTGDIEGVAYSMDISRDKRRDEILRIITSQEYDLIALLHMDKQTVEAYFLGDTLPHEFKELLPAPGAVYDLSLYRQKAINEWLEPEDREKYRQCSDPAFYLPLMDKYGKFEFVLREKFSDTEGGVMYRKFQHYYLGNNHDTVLVIESDVTSTYRTQQQELEKAKAETERVTDIMDYINVGIGVLHMPDPEHLSISYINQQMFRLLGFAVGSGEASALSSNPNGMIRGYVSDAYSGLHPDDLERVRKVFHDNFDSEYFTVDNYRTLGADGKYYWIKEEVRLREVTPEYRIFYATYNDVSEEVRLNKELTKQLENEKQLRQEAIAANSAKTDFLSRMSHDIRTPLNGIIGMTYLTQEMALPEPAQKNLQKISTSSKFLLGLVNDILDMSKAEREQIAFHPEPYPYADFCAYLDAVIRPLCAEKRQEFRFDSDPIKGYTPIIDVMKLNQIYFNLLSNAVKYTPEGGIITLKIREKMIDDSHIRFNLTVSDNGIGMSSEFQKTMFDPFAQENRDDISFNRGSGLGLAIVKRIVDAMNGTIEVESTKNIGSSFTVYRAIINRYKVSFVQSHLTKYI
jgi:PAS domain S-box-containing protein